MNWKVAWVDEGSAALSQLGLELSAVVFLIAQGADTVYFGLYGIRC